VESLLEVCWGAVGGEPGPASRLHVSDGDAWLGGPLPVDDLAVAAVGAALLAAAELSHARGAGRPAVTVSAEHVALSFRSEAHALSAGRPGGAGFGALSRFVRCRDGRWARTHGNYPHHAAALGRALGLDAGADDAGESLLRAAAAIDASALERAAFDAGGCAVALRSRTEWLSEPAGRAVEDGSLIAFRDAPAGPKRPLVSAPPDPARPAAGVRVLDLTRVIAGPVAGRTLAALGADVLRIDPPTLPEFPAVHLDTGPAKRSATLDLADADRREALLDQADVILTGYRPGALARFGLHADQLAERHPHLVQVSLSAWGRTGQWRERRGFDSLVQVASGIAVECAAPDGTPGTLPAQALDHATGHLMAAAALRGLALRAAGRPVRVADLALACTAAALFRAPRPEHVATEATGRADPDRFRVSFGEVSLIAPPGALGGTPLRWAHGPRALGGDPPVFTGD
jgi:hypothetical protein